MGAQIPSTLESSRVIPPVLGAVRAGVIASLWEGKASLRDIVCLRREWRWNSSVQVLERLCFLSERFF